MSAEIAQQTTHNEQARPVFWLALTVLSAAFFLSEHSWTVSLADSYTSTADEMESQAAGGNATRRTAFLAVAALGILLLLSPTRRRLHLSGGVGLCLLGYVGWAGLSVTWSQDLSLTIRRVLAMGCLLVGALGIGSCLTRRELLRLAWMIPGLSLLLGVAAEVSLGTFHPLTGDYRFAGTVHPNTQGLYLAALCLAAFCLCRESHWRKAGPILLLTVGFTFLLLTKSRTSCAGFLIAATLLLTLRTPSAVKWAAGFAGIGIIAAVTLVVMLFGLDVESELTDAALLGRQEQTGSLTGRMPIWTELTDSIAKRPLAGYGYDSFWSADRIDDVSTNLQWGIHEAHSAYIDTLLSLGVVGLLLLLTCVTLAMISASQFYRTEAHPQDGFLFGLLAFALINALMESGMTMPLFVPFLAVCGVASLICRQATAGAGVVERGFALSPSNDAGPTAWRWVGDSRNPARGTLP
ncbi:MAG: O-antigen ligase family protein [Planctomycetes bacterium]|nr:O-antigen ligase family protein [Planctomycetota bacterium]